ncbi:MAG: hypothetical protein J6S58_02010 [Lentisphaeria bacterium]|nr:hypothetical protein [Lentisphaeria bacterium]
MNRREDLEEAVSDYIWSLLTEEICPSHIEKVAWLSNNFRRYLAHKRNRVQYELNEILNTALRTLEINGVIKRDVNSQDKYIRKYTLFTFSSNNSGEIASRENYRKNQGNVPQYTTQMRGGTLEHSRIITPSDALLLVQELLHAFGDNCWTCQDDLFWAMQNHVPEQMNVVPMESVSPDGEKESIDPAEENSDQYIYEFTQEQVQRIAWENAQTVWQRLCKVNNEVFCLYLLPKNMGKSITQKQFGCTSTVSDQVDKMEKILREEWQEYSHMEKKQELRLVFRQIFEFLHGRCTENGYNPGLLNTDEEKGEANE